MSEKTLLIFGATGDLAMLHVVPALISLMKSAQPPFARIVFSAPQGYSTEDYVTHVAHILETKQQHSLAEGLRALHQAETIVYCQHIFEG